MRDAARHAAPWRVAAVAAVVLALLSGCQTPSVQPSLPGPHPSIPAPGSLPVPTPPRDPSQIPDAVPREEPRSAKGNPPFYTVLGKRYFVLPSASGYVERGVASWYGPGFHAAHTSNGERYDMYAMTAAHKTLPLPCYVRVTHLGNGRSVVVRVNDRGPFKDGRIIDLSHTAASKLGFLNDGTAFVEVRALTPGNAANATDAPVAANLYVQAGAFAAEANATRLLGQLRAQGVDNAFVRQDVVGGKTIYRVRVGPVSNVAAFDRAVARLKALGVTDARLASD